MLKLSLVCHGRAALCPLREASEDYGRRLRHFAQFRLERFKCEKAFARRVAQAPYRVLLDPRGRALRSEEVAQRLRYFQGASLGEITFVVGAAAGLNAAARSTSQELWSLSALTMPHRLAQVVLLEQIYRGFTLLAGLPYHRG